jgi:hypothetical protein
MKIKQEVKQKLVSGELGSRCDIWELEESDFDKAIQLLFKHNKKTAVKEYQLLKEDFINGELDSWDRDAERFTRNLQETALKRRTGVEARRIRKDILNVFDEDNKDNMLRFVRTIAGVYASKKNAVKEIDYQTKMLAIIEQKISALNKWFDTEELQGDLLETLTEQQREEIYQVLQEIKDANDEDEVEKLRWR